MGDHERRVSQCLGRTLGDLGMWATSDCVLCLLWVSSVLWLLRFASTPFLAFARPWKQYRDYPVLTSRQQVPSVPVCRLRTPKDC